MGEIKHIELTREQLIEGTKHCYENAFALKEEGDILFHHQRWARAIALYILGVEEISKIELLGLKYSYPDITWKEFRKKFVEHTPKLKIADQISLQSAFRSGDNERFIKEIMELSAGRNLNLEKQKNIYVDYDKKGWLLPNNATKEEAEEFRNCLQNTLNLFSKTFSRSMEDLKIYFQEMEKFVTSEVAKEDLRDMITEMAIEAKKIIAEKIS
jgi:AbiV family abortive infection protein